MAQGVSLHIGLNRVDPNHYRVGRRLAVPADGEAGVDGVQLERAEGIGRVAQ